MGGEFLAQLKEMWNTGYDIRPALSRKFDGTDKPNQ